MKKSFVASIAIAASLTLTTPAFANPSLPIGDELFEVSCSNDVNDRQLHSVNLSENIRTAVGTGFGSNAGRDCASQGAIFPGTDWFYFIDFLGYYLVRIDLKTGSTEEIGAIRTLAGDLPVYSLAIDDEGNAYVLDYDTLYSLDLTTGVSTELREADTYGLDGGYPYGFAYDPKTDKLYMAEDGAGGLYTLNIATGAFTHVATNEDYWVGSMSFDSDGYLWVNGDGNQISRTSVSGFGDSANWSDSAALTPNVYSESLVVSRPASNDDDEGLANTGAGDVTPWLAFAAATAIVAIALRRRTV